MRLFQRLALGAIGSLLVVIGLSLAFTGSAATPAHLCFLGALVCFSAVISGFALDLGARRLAEAALSLCALALFLASTELIFASHLNLPHRVVIALTLWPAAIRGLVRGWRSGFGLTPELPAL